MQSINTLFNGNYFRSRLEARWAVFFTAAGIKYEYEPEGFTNGKGGCYLPDFYLPETYLRSSKGVYIEIKPISYEGVDVFASDWFDKNLVLFKGCPDINVWGNDGDIVSGYECYEGVWDDSMKLWLCSDCNASKVEYWEGNYNHCPIKNCKGDCNEDWLKELSIIANKARFEHNFK